MPGSSIPYTAWGPTTSALIPIQVWLKSLKSISFVQSKDELGKDPQKLARMNSSGTKCIFRVAQVKSRRL